MAPRSANKDRRLIPGGDTLPTHCRVTVKATGRQCQRAPMVGVEVCYVHGGRLPSVRAKADRVVAETAAKVEIDAIIGRMNLDAEPVRDPTVALGTLAGRLLSGFEVNTARVNAKVEAGSEPSDYDVAERKLLVRELRQVLTDMTRLQIGVALGMQYVQKADPKGQEAPGIDELPDGVVRGEIEAPAPEIGAIVAGVLEAEARHETERLVRLREAELAAGLPSPLAIVEAVVREESA